MSSRILCRPVPWVAIVCLAVASPVAAQSDDAEYVRANYTKFEYRVPVRDGVRLFTVAYVPKDTSKTYPILLTRTPYGVGPYGPDQQPGRLSPSPAFWRAGYVFVHQDVRGRMRSEGTFVHGTPHKAIKNTPADVDESSDAFDTIDWLLKNVPGRGDPPGGPAVSMAALLLGTEATLRTFLSDPDGKESGVQPAPGAPPAVFGQRYYAIHAGAITGDQATNTLANDKLYAVQVTITVKTAYAPKDRKGARLVAENELIERAEAVADLLHMNYGLVAAANERIPGTAEYCDVHGGSPTVNGFDEHPPVLESISPPSEAAADWTGGDANPGDVLVCTVTVGGCRRVRPL